jgi:hypothetical protein
MEVGIKHVNNLLISSNFEENDFTASFLSTRRERRERPQTGRNTARTGIHSAMNISHGKKSFPKLSNRESSTFRKTPVYTGPRPLRSSHGVLSCTNLLSVHNLDKTSNGS